MKKLKIRWIWCNYYNCWQYYTDCAIGFSHGIRTPEDESELVASWG